MGNVEYLGLANRAHKRNRTQPWRPVAPAWRYNNASIAFPATARMRQEQALVATVVRATPRRNRHRRRRRARRDTRARHRRMRQSEMPARAVECGAAGGAKRVQRSACPVWWARASPEEGPLTGCAPRPAGHTRPPPPPHPWPGPTGRIPAASNLGGPVLGIAETACRAWRQVSRGRLERLSAPPPSGNRSSYRPRGATCGGRPR